MGLAGKRQHISTDKRMGAGEENKEKWDKHGAFKEQLFQKNYSMRSGQVTDQMSTVGFRNPWCLDWGLIR